jgi:hypothetical protein
MQTFYNFLLYPFIELLKLYKHGFSIMSKESKSLWIIAVVKLFIMTEGSMIFLHKSEKGHKLSPFSRK